MEILVLTDSAQCAERISNIFTGKYSTFTGSDLDEITLRCCLPEAIALYIDMDLPQADAAVVAMNVAKITETLPVFTLERVNASTPEVDYSRDNGTYMPIMKRTPAVEVAALLKHAVVHWGEFLAVKRAQDARRLKRLAEYQ